MNSIQVWTKYMEVMHMSNKHRNHHMKLRLKITNNKYAYNVHFVDTLPTSLQVGVQVVTKIGVCMHDINE